MEKNPDYSKTCIYKIVPNNNKLNYCYIGNTTNIEQRVKNHRSNCENINSCSYNRLLYKTIRENGGWNEWTLEEIEYFPCNNDIEARQREQHYIKQLNSNLNLIRAFRTEEEKIEQINTDNRTLEQLREKTKKYYDNNKELCNEKSKIYYNNHKDYFEKKRKEYYEANKDKIKEKNSEKIICMCGSIITKKSKARHEKTEKHINSLK